MKKSIYSEFSSIVQGSTAPVITTEEIEEIAYYTIVDSLDPGTGVTIDTSNPGSIVINSIDDHGNLNGLGDDDHPQYIKATGRSGGQILIGGTGSGDDLTFQTTSNATKGSYIFSELTASRILAIDSNNSLQALDIGIYPSLVELSYVKGVTSNIQTQINNKQDSDPTLIAIAAYNTNGLFTQVAPDTFAGRTITAGSGITVSNGNGVSGNPIISIDNTTVEELARDAVEAALTEGLGVDIAVNDASNTITLQSGASQVFSLNAAANHYRVNAETGFAFTSTIAQVANRIEFYPFMPPAQDLAITELAINVTAAVASAKVRVGVYADSSGIPGSLLLDAGEFNCASTGTKTATVSITLQKGVPYWLCVFSNSTATLRAIPNTSVLPLAIDFATGTQRTAWRKDSVTYGALPNPAPSGLSFANPNPVMIGFK